VKQLSSTGKIAPEADAFSASSPANTDTRKRETGSDLTGIAPASGRVSAEANYLSDGFRKRQLNQKKRKDFTMHTSKKLDAAA